MSGGIQYCNFTKSLIFRCFYSLVNIVSDVCIFMCIFLLENFHACPVTEGPKLRCYTPPPPIERGSGPNRFRFLYNQFYLSDTRNLVSVQKQMTGDPSVNLVTSHYLAHILQTVLYFTLTFYRLVCKIVNLQNIDLKFLGSISDVNIDKCAKFC